MLQTLASTVKRVSGSVGHGDGSVQFLCNTLVLRRPLISTLAINERWDFDIRVFLLAQSVSLCP